VLLRSEPAEALPGLLVLHLTILPNSNQDKKRSESEQLSTIDICVKIAEYLLCNRHNSPHRHTFVNMT
jgi:hypothetical protein